MPKIATKTPKKPKYDWRDTCAGCSKQIAVGEQAVDIRIGKILPVNSRSGQDRFAIKKKWGRICIPCFSSGFGDPAGQ